VGTEIERKFLVRDDDWRAAASPGKRLRQGYLARTAACSVRVRIGGDVAWLNVKSAQPGLTRLEYEYPLPVADAEAMLDSFCPHAPVEKTRYEVSHAGSRWEIDVFEGANAGLVVAEIELADESESFERPAWLGEEVSGERRYYNADLVDHPYSRW
jgi:adenylate cyclase